MPGWGVICKPAGENVGENTAGLAVVVTDGVEEIETARVAFVRRNSRNPNRAFIEQLNEEIGKAQNAVDVVNEMLDEWERAREEKVFEARDRVREAFSEVEVRLA